MFIISKYGKKNLPYCCRLESANSFNKNELFNVCKIKLLNYQTKFSNPNRILRLLLMLLKYIFQSLIILKQKKNIIHKYKQLFIIFFIIYNNIQISSFFSASVHLLLTIHYRNFDINSLLVFSCASLMYFLKKYQI